MTDERWRDLLAHIEEKFAIEERKTIPTEDKRGTIEMVIFSGQSGKVKLERISRPRALGTKTQYSKRIGSSVSVEHIYSDTEQVHSLKAYRWNADDNDWQEIKPEHII